jgi:hypothetical protein
MPAPLNWLVYLLAIVFVLVVLLWFMRQVGMTV